MKKSSSNRTLVLLSVLFVLLYGYLSANPIDLDGPYMLLFAVGVAVVVISAWKVAVLGFRGLGVLVRVFMEAAFPGANTPSPTTQPTVSARAGICMGCGQVFPAAGENPPPCAKCGAGVMVVVVTGTAAELTSLARAGVAPAAGGPV